ncbi:hypothetical protein [Hymenobacter pini]|uniref:hypothetical protein n=1 Tax=Hymenobacter pini TaxID=2880879 RepID=UPI001CF10C36|nr:hypothetical protein [Hymenobacter pini]MCA8830933.1 hypothetical protein [Hymenobacter pini]
MSIIWQNQEIGVLRNVVPDMWYLEGVWAGNNSPAANSFEAVARALNAKAIYKNLDNGIEVWLQDDEGTLTGAVVLSLTEPNILFLRRITSSLPNGPANPAISIFSSILQKITALLTQLR